MTAINRAISEIESAIGEWSTADWSHELACRHDECDECPSWQDISDGKAQQPYCDGDDPDHCATCVSAAEDAEDADAHARRAIEHLRDREWIEADAELERACEREQEYGDAPVWGSVRDNVRKLATEVIDAEWDSVAGAGLRILSQRTDRGAAIIDDGGDRWMTYTADLHVSESEDWDQAAQRAQALHEDPDQAGIDAYQEMCDEAPVLISMQGTSRGTRAEQAQLLALAVSESLIDRDDAREWGRSIS